MISTKEDTTLPQLESEISTTPKQSTMTKIEVKKGRDTVDQKDTENLINYTPPFLERLTLPKPIVSLYFYLLGELKNLCIKIPLLYAIQDIAIYAKTIKELCGKK